MNKMNVPDFGGTWTWDGDLNLDTMITLANGFQMSLQGIITQTNGDALKWVDDWEASQVKKAFLDLDGFWVQQHLENAPVDVKVQAVEHYMTLPLYKVAPDLFKAQAIRFLVVNK